MYTALKASISECHVHSYAHCDPSRPAWPYLRHASERSRVYNTFSGPALPSKQKLLTFCVYHIHCDSADRSFSDMSGTLISSIAWVPRGRSALQPKKYTLDEAELERVGKLGGPGVLEQLKAQMAEAEAEDSEEEGDDWEE